MPGPLQLHVVVGKSCLVSWRSLHMLASKEIASRVGGENLFGG